jgi:hypothetical protein
MSARSIGLGVVGAVVGFLLPPGNVAGAVALGAAGFQAGAEMDSADESVKAQKLNRALQSQQANETLQRASENTKAIMREAEGFRGQQVSGMVRGGVDISSESSLVALESADANFKRQAFLEERDASLTAQRIRAQAQINVDYAKKAREAAQIGAVTSVIGTAAGVYANGVKAPTTGGGGSSNYNGTRMGGQSNYNAGSVA